MNDDYLWDKQGHDPEVEALEKLLRPLGWKETPPPAIPLARPQAAPGSGSASPSPSPRRWRRFALAGAAAAVLAATGLAVSVVRNPDAPGPGPTYTVHDGAREFPASTGARLDAGSAELRIELAGIGRLVAEPETRLSVIAIGDDLHKLRLERGTVHASIGGSVRPRLFQIETPATTCIDLGCSYTLSVDEAGRAVVRVELGRVAFQDGDREVYVPRGAACRAAPPRGSGTPCFEDASAELAKAVRAFDEANVAARAEAAKALAALVLSDGRARDTLVLWHLLQDRDGAVVAAGLDALLAAHALPAGTTREQALRRDGRALEAWKEVLAADWR